MGGIEIEISDNHVISAVNLSRVNNELPDINFYGKLNQILHLGREIDLLEIIRRQENPGRDFFTIPREQFDIHGLAVGIERVTLEKVSLVNFQDNSLINIIDDETIEVNFKNSEKILRYGKSQIRNELSSKNQKLLNLLAKGMIKPVQLKSLSKCYFRISWFSRQLP